MDTKYCVDTDMYGAGDGNRTHDNSLEGCSFTTKLHPRVIIIRLILTKKLHGCNTKLNFMRKNVDNCHIISQ